MAQRCLKQAASGCCAGHYPVALRSYPSRCYQQSHWMGWNSKAGAGGGLCSNIKPALTSAKNVSRHQRNPHGVVVRAAPEGTSEPYPWAESEYHRVEFVKDPYGPVAIDSSPSQWRGVLLFQLASDTQPVTEDTRVMEIFISGDACISIYTHLCPGDNTRPMALDILWQMWQRGRAMSKRDWTLLRVAVVQCVNDVYYGRLFFGDPDTQQVMWDTDVRPSDATFLALKAGAPIYVRKSVWDACSTPLRNSSTWPTVAYARRQEDERLRAGSGSSSGRSSEEIEQHRKEQVAAKCDVEALPAIRLLMREMEVAVSDEDYEQAARLRDHPWMRLADDIKMHRTIGYVDQAIKLYGELQAMIEGHEQAMQFDYQARLAAQQEARQRLDNLVQSYPPHPDQGPDQPPPGLQQQQQRSEQGDSSGLQQNESSKRD